MPGDRLADIKDAGDIRLQQLLPALGGKVFKRRAKLHSCIVDEDVDGADILLDLIDAALYRVRVRDVEIRDIDSVAGILQRGSSRFQLRTVATVEDKCSAVFGKTTRQRQAYPLR
ncbi:hypothetical protein D9M72_630130 [compost metagenome]